MGEGVVHPRLIGDDHGDAAEGYAKHDLEGQLAVATFKSFCACVNSLYRYCAEIALLLTDVIVSVAEVMNDAPVVISFEISLATPSFTNSPHSLHLPISTE